jgi:hypothetical protein
MGFIGTKDTLLAQTKTDASGNFQLNYPKRYKGAANLQVKEMTSLIVMLNNENFEITWADFKDFTGVQFTNSKENKTQVEAIDLENSLKILNYNGIIFIHDTDPISKKYTDYGYCGDSYNINNYIYNNHPELDLITLPLTEAGLTIVKRKHENRYNLYV